MKVLKIVGAILLGLVGLAVLLYVIGVAVNWRDQPPSAAALEMKKILADRAPVADADNGFVYVMGFCVPASEDPLAAGALRKAWIESVNRDPKLIDAEPVKKDVDFNASALTSPWMCVRKSCGDALVLRNAATLSWRPCRSRVRRSRICTWRDIARCCSGRRGVKWCRSMCAYRSHRTATSSMANGSLFVDLAARAKSAPPGEIAAALRDDLRVLARDAEVSRLACSPG